MSELMCPHCGTAIRVEIQVASVTDTSELFPWLSRRVYNALRRRGIRTIEQLRKCSDYDLNLMLGIGPRSLLEIENALTEWERKA